MSLMDGKVWFAGAECYHRSTGCAERGKVGGTAYLIEESNPRLVGHRRCKICFKERSP